MLTIHSRMLLNNHGCTQFISECYSYRIDGLNPLSGFVLVFLFWKVNKAEQSGVVVKHVSVYNKAATILASHKLAPWLYFESWRIFLLVAKYKICDNLKQAILWWLKRCAEAEVHGSNLASPTIILESQRIIVYCVILRRKEIIGPFRL